MRLTEYEVKSIKESFLNIFEEGTLSLFGSRVDDAKKGGDIDLYIQTPKEKATLENKIKFLVILKEIGKSEESLSRKQERNVLMSI